MRTQAPLCSSLCAAGEPCSITADGKCDAINGHAKTDANSASLLEQIEACRREVAAWPEWMRAEVREPVWMSNRATDL